MYINTDISLHNKDITKPSHNVVFILVNMQVEINDWQEEILQEKQAHIFDFTTRTLHCLFISGSQEIALEEKL